MNLFFLQKKLDIGLYCMISTFGLLFLRNGDINETEIDENVQNITFAKIMLNLTYCPQMYDQFVNIFASHYMFGTSYQDCTYIPYLVFLLKGKYHLHVEPKNVHISCKLGLNNYLRKCKQLQTLVGYRGKGLLSIYDQFSW